MSDVAARPIKADQRHELSWGWLSFIDESSRQSRALRLGGRGVVQRHRARGVPDGSRRVQRGAPVAAARLLLSANPQILIPTTLRHV
jgi:hypothetical protein